MRPAPADPAASADRGRAGGAGAERPPLPTLGDGYDSQVSTLSQRASGGTVDPWLVSNLVCPRTHQRLEWRSDSLVSPAGYTYPIIDGIPILLVDEAEPTNPVRFENTRRQVADPLSKPPDPDLGPDEIDPHVRQNLVPTLGRMYRSCADRLTRYPIPDFPLPAGESRRLLDIGSGWGRWSIAAAAKGYLPVGIDPSIDRARVARRIARQIGVEATFIVADGRYVPFAADCFDTVFSFGVLQHFLKKDVREVLPHVRRVLRGGGESLIQMATRWGLHNVWAQLRRLPRAPWAFMVQYWTHAELRRTFTALIGPSRISPDAFFTLNAQATDLDVLPWRYRCVVRASTQLCLLSGAVPWMGRLADSVFVRSVVS